jgi:hypothetical protein
MEDTNTAAAGADALRLIKALAAQGHSHGYIAKHLNDRNVPTARNGRWSNGSVFNLAKKHGVKIGYDPTRRITAA